VIDSGAAKSILIKARKSRDELNEVICLFKEFLSLDRSRDLTKYYLARNLLQEGLKLLAETIQEAKKFLGPPPEYASVEINLAREQLLQVSRVILQSRSLEDAEVELRADEFLKLFVNADEISAYLQAAGKEPATGRRKLCNIKVRMIIDKLISLGNEAQEWQKRSREKIQANPS